MSKLPSVISWQFAVTNLSRVLATCLTSLKIVLVRKVTDLRAATVSDLSCPSEIFLEPLEDRRLLAADFSLSVSDGDVTEVGANPGEFTVLGTGTTAAPTVINLTIAGTATAGGIDDSTILVQLLLIPAGTNTSQTIDVQGIIDDSLFEGDETVIVTLDSIASGDVGNTIDQASKTQSVDIVDDELAVVSVAVQDGAASETGPDDGAFRISLDKANNTGDTITVNYTMTGVATNGTDYATVDGTAEIADGNTFVDVLVDVLPDSIVEATDSVTITLNSLTLPLHVDAGKISIDTNNAEVHYIIDNDSVEKYCCWRSGLPQRLRRTLVSSRLRYRISLRRIRQ